MINLRELEDELESLYTTAFNESHEAAKERDLEHTARQCGPDVTDHGWDLLEEAGRGDIEATEIETEAASDLMTEVRD